MRFDAWNATFPNDSIKKVRQLLTSSLAASFKDRKGGLHGYMKSEEIIADERTIGVLAWGGVNSRFFVEVKGEPAQAWWQAVVDALPSWDGSEEFAQLTRVDVCHDWEDIRDVVELAPGLRAAVESSPEKRRPPQWRQEGDWFSPEGRARGCTLYMGSPASAVRVRLYDKGRELKGKGIEAPDSLRRVEIQARPGSQIEKVLWVRAEPLSFWSISGAVRVVARHFGIDADSNVVRIPQPPAEMERLKTLAAVQYGEALTAWILDLAKASENDETLKDRMLADLERRRLLHAVKRAA